jgi:hypothetical protein
MAGLGTQGVRLPKTADYSDQLVSLVAGDQPKRRQPPVYDGSGNQAPVNGMPVRPPYGGGGGQSPMPVANAGEAEQMRYPMAEVTDGGDGRPMQQMGAPDPRMRGSNANVGGGFAQFFNGLGGGLGNSWANNPRPGGSTGAPGSGSGGAVTSNAIRLGPVATGVQGIIDNNSPLMQQAAAYGRDQLNARGLVNSSMAIGAAQAEMLKAATPIASQEADITSRMDISKLDASTQAAIQSQRDASAAALQKTQGEQQTAQQAAEAKARADLQGTIGSQNLTLAEKEAASRAALLEKEAASKAELQGKELTSLEARAAADNAAKQTLAEKELAQRERAELAKAITDVSVAQQNAYADTLTNDKIPVGARTDAQTNITTISTNTITKLETLYGVSTSGTPTPTPTPAPDAGVAPLRGPLATP